MSAVPPGGMPPPIYSPVTRPVVGNESAEQKVQALPPVEQPDQAEQLRDRQRRGEHPPHREEEASAPVPDEGAPAEASPPAAAAPAPAFRILPAGGSPAPSARALEAFEQAASNPGQMLDGRA